MLTQNIKPQPPTHWLPPAIPTPPAAAVGWKSAAMPAVFAGLAAMAVGLFMPWITLIAPFVGQINRNGIDSSDGQVAAGAVAIVVIMAFMEAQTPNVARRIFMLLVVLVVGLIVVVDYNDVAGRVAEVNADDFGAAQIGIGLYLMGSGVVAAALALVSRMATLANH